MKRKPCPGVSHRRASDASKGREGYHHELLQGVGRKRGERRGCPVCPLPVAGGES